ncbi:ABC transporter ATP-binding protein [Alicyclobacillus fodiniaquatilis]|uniref:ABC transporter ATP-binding protein n=1 Tax=Alicyclobacillus fodiniaquatilis TaxID=1661150 RepID=A0ABW4JPE9_9BACL
MSRLLEVKNLSTEFTRPNGVVYAVNGVSFHVDQGESVGIVGESGSGKSVSVLSVLGLIANNGRVTNGEAIFNGQDLLHLNERQLRAIRGTEIGVIFQDPMTSLNPVKRIGWQIAESMVKHHLCNKREALSRAIDLLAEVGIPDAETRYRNYPFEFSGGMRQRVMIAIALACKPQLLIADEPTTALDMTVQMQVLALLRESARSRNMATLIITHDFGVATNLCSRLIVMYGSKIMEMATVEEFVRRPAHPYSIGLKSSIISIGNRHKKISAIPGNAPVFTTPPEGCPFASRCGFALERCYKEIPPLRTLFPGHEVACHRAEEVMSNVI